MQLQHDTYMYIGKHFLPGLSQHHALQDDSSNAMITRYINKTSSVYTDNMH